jgi:hypothetical protein
VKLTKLIVSAIGFLFVLSLPGNLLSAQTSGTGKSGSGTGGTGSATGKSGGDTSGGGKGVNSAAGQGAATAPFETQVLAYGAVDQIALAIAKSACAQIIKDKAAATIIIYDATAFSSIQSYGGYEATLQVLRAAYKKIQSDATGKAEEAGIQDVAALILQYAGASTVENPSSITIVDDAVKLSIAHYLMSPKSNDWPCDPQNITVLYPALVTKSAADQNATDAISKELVGITTLKAQVGAILNDPTKPKRDSNDPLILRYQDVNKSFDQFITGLLTKDPTTGAVGIGLVLSGYQLYNQIKKKGSYILFEEAVAGGGTQRIRKNLFTNVFWGDLIRYSGGAVITFALIDGLSSSIKVANTLRFRTPSTTIQHPDNARTKIVSAGDNLSSVQ